MSDATPVGTHWGGQEIPVFNGQNVFAYFSSHQGQDILKAQEEVMFRFDLTKEEFDYWLGEWRFTKR